MLGSAAAWWEGKRALDGGAKYEWTAVEEDGKAEVMRSESRREMFGHLIVRPHDGAGTVDGPVGKRKTDLSSYNDGSSLSLISIDKPVSTLARWDDPHLHVPGTTRMDGLQQGDYNQNTGWRAGDAGGISIDGSAAPAFQPPVDIQHQAAWRFGDTAAFSFDDSASPGEGSPAAARLRAGGVGRRVHPALMPHNDGSQMMMQAALTDKQIRERRTDEAYRLAHHSGSLAVEAVTKATHEAAARERIQNCDQMSGWREQQWDRRPFALDGADAPPNKSPAHPQRKHTDVTSEGPSWVAKARHLPFIQVPSSH
jgi:hypothetical protein